MSIFCEKNQIVIRILVRGAKPILPSLVLDEESLQKSNRGGQINQWNEFGSLFRIDFHLLSHNHFLSENSNDQDHLFIFNFSSHYISQLFFRSNLVSVFEQSCRNSATLQVH